MAKLVVSVLVLASLVLVWHIACSWLEIPTYLLPAPVEVFAAFSEHAGSLGLDLATTLFEAIAGFAIANLLGVGIAVAFFYSPKLGELALPYVVALKSVPVIAIAPLLVIWLGYGAQSKIAMAALIAFFPVVLNTIVGLSREEPQLELLMKSLGASKTDLLKKVRAPYALPYFFAGLQLSASLAVVGALVGEMSGANRGLGATILMASYNIETPLLFAAVILSAIAGLTLFFSTRLCATRVLGKFNLEEIQQQ